ncbi:uncharacterized protein LOC131179413 [Hevea brasiliensis]|uniref:uncharacterized protein LOC131179413 n=1 Tax=Hevea brasiliensis TaxID=3981 RepID=UPI0025EDE50A|nr:uncharacterized protein LOC131179413 [Hevea brasiliensis]
MTGGSLGLRGSYGSSQASAKFPAIARKSSSKMLVSSLREKERVLPVICRYFGRRRVAMMLLVALALLVFIWGSLTVDTGNSIFGPHSITNCKAYRDGDVEPRKQREQKDEKQILNESTSSNIKGASDPSPDVHAVQKFKTRSRASAAGSNSSDQSADIDTKKKNGRNTASLHQHGKAGGGSSQHPCHKFALPPPALPSGSSVIKGEQGAQARRQARRGAPLSPRLERLARLRGGDASGRRGERRRRREATPLHSNGKPFHQQTAFSSQPHEDAPQRLNLDDNRL